MNDDTFSEADSWHDFREFKKLLTNLMLPDFCFHEPNYREYMDKLEKLGQLVLRFDA